jgi:hypothetical protein
MSKLDDIKEATSDPDENASSKFEDDDNGNGHIGDLANGDVQSLIGQIADMREAAKGDHHLDLAIPGTNEMLWVRFRPFSANKTEKRMNEYRKAQQRGGAIVLITAIDTLIDACEQLMVLPPKFEGDIGVDGKNLVPIDDELPITFDERCADLFVKDPNERRAITKARHVVAAMFPTEQAIITMNVVVSRWMNDVTKSVDSDLVSD